MSGIAVVLTDIEGTAAPIQFVHDVLFPYARRALPDLLRTGRDDPEVAGAIKAVRAAAPKREPLETLLGWMDADSKAGPLKTLQGIAWRAGYASGALQGDLYRDVAPALHRWHQRGLRLAVYSSGSVEAQRLIFGHTPEGDLTGLFEAFFDTGVGAKREVASYARIASELGVECGRILFLSDVAAELDAAAASGLRTCQLLRPDVAAAASDLHPHAADLDAVERLLD